MSNSSCCHNGYSGMENLGNTCFLNSCLQILLHTQELNLLFKNTIPKDNITTINIDKKNAGLHLVNEYKQLYDFIWTPTNTKSYNTVISPRRFVHQIHKIAHITNRELFTGWAQNDLTEFLIFFIEYLHMGLYEKKYYELKQNNIPMSKIDNVCIQTLQKIYNTEYSKLLDLFYGIHISEIHSVRKLESIVPEPFCVIHLPIPQTNQDITIYDCLNKYTEKELLIKENQWYNENTRQKEDATKQISFWFLPSILIFIFVRFKPNSIKKNNKFIHFPIKELNMEKYFTLQSKITQQTQYSLYGVANHYGTTSGGHYTAFVKHAVNTNEWLHFNDAKVDRIEDVNAIVTNNAYCLFYRQN